MVINVNNHDIDYLNYFNFHMVSHNGQENLNNIILIIYVTLQPILVS